MRASHIPLAAALLAAAMHLGAHADAAVDNDTATTLARASLRQQGYDHPTPEQLAQERKLLQRKHAQGHSWHDIGQSLKASGQQFVQDAQTAGHATAQAARSGWHRLTGGSAPREAPTAGKDGQ